MVYLIDFENINNEGMEGYEYLTEQDSICIFYSQSAPNIRKRIAAKVFEHSMDVSLYKLLTARKNAIDFYIASKLGQLVEQRKAEKIAIVSKDQGFQSIVDYWGHVSEKKCKVILEKSIAECILKARCGDEQYRTVKYDWMQTPLELLYSEYEQQRELERKLRQRLQGTEFELEEQEVVRIISKADNRKVLYLSALKQFGRDRGTRLYANIKDIKVS